MTDNRQEVPLYPTDAPAAPLRPAGGAPGIPPQGPPLQGPPPRRPGAPAHMPPQPPRRQNGNKSLKAIVIIVAVLAVLAPYVALYVVNRNYNKTLEKVERASTIIISKEDMKLRVYGYDGTLRHEYGIAVGKAHGNKGERGDMRTPEGVFCVESIEEASHWEHDFGDGKGKIAGAYGPWFIRLATPGHKGIGIHGTHKPESIGTRDTEGCIRLNNADLERLKPDVYPGEVVIITPSVADAAAMLKAAEKPKAEKAARPKAEKKPEAARPKAEKPKAEKPKAAKPAPAKDRKQTRR